MPSSRTSSERDHPVHAAPATTGRPPADAIGVVVRLTFAAGIAAAGFLGFIGAMGRGPGLFLGVLLMAAYAFARRRSISTRGFELMLLGLAIVVALWWAVPLL